MRLGRWLSYQVCDAEVHGQRNNGGHEAGPECACEVGDIADEPDCEEDERNAVCGARLVVLNQLRDLVSLAIGHDIGRVRHEISFQHVSPRSHKEAAQSCRYRRSSSSRPRKKRHCTKLSTQQWLYNALQEDRAVGRRLTNRKIQAQRLMEPQMPLRASRVVRWWLAAAARADCNMVFRVVVTAQSPRTTRTELWRTEVLCSARLGKLVDPSRYDAGRRNGCQSEG